MTFGIQMTIRNRLFVIGTIVVLGLVAMIALQLYSSSRIAALEHIQYQNAAMEIEMLTLRRHEKDFLARQDLKYHQRFNETSDLAIADTEQLIVELTDIGLSADSATRLKALLADYSKHFNQLVELQQRIGLDHESGLYGNLRQSVHGVESRLKEIGDDTLTVDMLMLRRHEKDFMLRWLPKYIDKFNLQIDVFYANLSQSNYSHHIQDELYSLMDSYKTGFTAFVAGMQEKGLDSSSGIRGEMRETVHKTEALFVELRDEIAAVISSERTALATTSLVIALVIIAVVVAALAMLATSIIRPIDRLQSVMQEVANSKNLSLRSDIQGQDEIAAMSASFNEMIEVFDNSIQEVHQSTVMLASASEELSLITQNTRDGVQRQQSETHQVATAMNEMTATVQDVARSATGAAKASSQADEHSARGRTIVNDTIEGIKHLSGEIDRNSDEIHHLQEETKNINTVLQVITDIAEQTNLLALNAAIEAARAGEQGRGFAVVADEVRTLASRSHESTQEIKQIIDQLQSRAGTAVQGMENSRTAANSCVSQADTAGEALDEIKKAVSSINDMNLQIASAAEQQSVVAEEINMNITNINEVAGESTTAASETLETSHSLAQMATELQAVVNQFSFREKG